MVRKKRDFYKGQDRFSIIPVEVAAGALKILSEDRALRSMHSNDETLDLSSFIIRQAKEDKMRSGEMSKIRTEYDHQHAVLLRSQMECCGFNNWETGILLERGNEGAQGFSIFTGRRHPDTAPDDNYTARLDFRKVSDLGLYYFSEYRVVLSTLSGNWVEDVKVDNLNLRNMNFNTTPTLKDTLSKLRDTDRRYELRQIQENHNHNKNRGRRFKM